jgi:hypothetical protein
MPVAPVKWTKRPRLSPVGKRIEAAATPAAEHVDVKIPFRKILPVASVSIAHRDGRRIALS